MTFAGDGNSSASAGGGGPVTIYTVPANRYFRGYIQTIQGGSGGFAIRVNGIAIGSSWPDALSSIWFPPGTVFSIAASGGTVEARTIGALFRSITP